MHTVAAARGPASALCVSAHASRGQHARLINAAVIDLQCGGAMHRLAAGRPLVAKRSRPRVARQALACTCSTARRLRLASCTCNRKRTHTRTARALIDLSRGARACACSHHDHDQPRTASVGLTKLSLASTHHLLVARVCRISSATQLRWPSCGGHYRDGAGLSCTGRCRRRHPCRRHPRQHQQRCCPRRRHQVPALGTGSCRRPGRRSWQRAAAAWWPRSSSTWRGRRR